MTNSEPQQIPQQPLHPGQVLLGKFRIERIIGRGGMGTVVEARHLVLDERVALKFLLPQLAVVPDAVQRFMREARAAIRIKSEHVARVMDVAALETGEPFLVLEFLDGRDLLQVVKDEGPLSMHEAVDTMLQACHALAEAHALGIIHRDIKPGNLFRARASDGGSLVKVLDFGLSKVMGGRGVDALTRTQATMGSAHYMAPEQMHSLRDVDHRADVYSLGVTLYVLLSGKHPYPGTNMPAVYAAILTGQPVPLQQWRPEMPEPFARAIAKAYDRDPASRYQSVGELAMALAPFAPPQSRATLDRISRLVARPHTDPIFMPGVQPLPLEERPRRPSGTELLPEAPSPSPTSTPMERDGNDPSTAATRLWEGRLQLPVSNTPLVVALLVLGAIGAGVLFLGWRWFRGPTVDEVPTAAAPIDQPAAAQAEATAPAQTEPPPAASAALPEPPTSATAAASAAPPPAKAPAKTRAAPPRAAATPAAPAAPQSPARPSPFDMR